MSLRSKLAYYLRVIARYVEDPTQLALRRHYFMPGMYRAFKEPWIQALGIATVLDIGASVGDFAFTIRSLLRDARIYSFEPLPDCFAAMLQHLEGVPNFTAFNLALGDQAGELVLQRSTHAPSSSFLKMTAAHRTAFPTSGESRLVSVKVERLDMIASQLDIADPLLIKIDVQGYEGHVLRGGEQTVRRAKLLVVETSFESLYAGQPLFDDVYQCLHRWGFSYLGPLDLLRHPQDERPLQEDSLFMKNGTGNGSA
jgi:FkbM family methyltransferase